MIIDFIRGNGGGGSGSTTVIDNVQSTSTTAALSANQGRILNEKFSGYTTVEEMSAYTTTEDVVEAITSATENMVTSDQITGFTTSADVETQITAATSAFTTTADVQSQITAATSGLVETEALTAYTPTSGFATINGSAITEGGNIVIQGGGGGTDPDAQHRFTASTVVDMNALTGVSEGDVCVVNGTTTYQYNDGSWVEIASKNDLTGFTTSAQLDPQMEVISTALNDLNTNTVRSTVIRNIVTISQAGYDALVAGGTVDSATFYIII